MEPVSLYEPVFSDGGDTIYIMDQVKGGTTDGDWLEEIAMREAIRDLTDRERKILSMRFIDGQNTDRSRRGDPHLAGTGLTLGKRRDEPH